MFKEFKEFIAKGNVIDLAVAVVIGAAFAAIVSSFVDDIITPLILTPALEAAGVENVSALTWNNVKYGNFLSALLKFLIVAFILFLIVKWINSYKRKKEEAPVPSVSKEEQLLMEIRDLLRNRP